MSNFPKKNCGKNISLKIFLKYCVKKFKKILC